MYLNSIQSVRELYIKQYGIVYDDLPLKAYSRWEDSTNTKIMKAVILLYKGGQEMEIRTMSSVLECQKGQKASPAKD